MVICFRWLDVLLVGFILVLSTIVVILIIWGEEIRSLADQKIRHARIAEEETKRYTKRISDLEELLRFAREREMRGGYMQNCTGQGSEFFGLFRDQY